jgi:hypothetical protein
VRLSSALLGVLRLLEIRVRLKTHCPPLQGLPRRQARSQETGACYQGENLHRLRTPWSLLARARRSFAYYWVNHLQKTLMNSKIKSVAILWVQLKILIFAREFCLGMRQPAQSARSSAPERARRLLS